MKTTLLSIVAASFLMINFTGCGGGGSSSGGNGGGNGSEEVSFPSNAAAAEPTQENAEKVAKTVVADPNSSLSNLGLNSVSSEKTVSNVGLLKQSTDIFNKSIQRHPLENQALNETVNQSSECTDGGSVTITGSGSDETGGTITMTYDNCQEDSTSMNGKIQSVTSDYNSDADDYAKMNITFLTDFSVSDSDVGSSFSFAYKAGSYINEKVNKFSDANGYMYPSDISIDTSYIITVNEMKFGLKDCAFNFKYNDSSMSDLDFTQSKGRIYIDNTLTKYVDVDTSYNPPVHYSYQYGTLESGKGYYIMANSTPLTITATGSGSYTTNIGNN